MRDGESASIYWLTPQVASMARNAARQSQESNCIHIALVGAGTQGLGASATVPGT